MREAEGSPSTEEALRLLAAPEAALDEEAFERAALSVFAGQYAGTAVFRAYCERVGSRPSEVRSWREIPALPTDAFKQAAVAIFPPEAATRVFMTSGTSQGPQSRGKVYKDPGALTLHDQAV